MEQAKLKALEDWVYELEEEVINNHQNAIQSIIAIKEELKEYKESEDVRYYLYADGTSDGGNSYLNRVTRKGRDYLMLGSKGDIVRNRGFKPTFTLEEIEELPLWCQTLTRIEVK